MREPVLRCRIADLSLCFSYMQKADFLMTQHIQSYEPLMSLKFVVVYVHLYCFMALPTFFLSILAWLGGKPEVLP